MDDAANAEPPLVNDPDADGVDRDNDEESIDPSPKTDVPGGDEPDELPLE